MAITDTGCVGAASGVAISAIAASLLYSAVMDYQSKSYHAVEIPRDTMVLFAQKQNNTSQ